MYTNTHIHTHTHTYAHTQTQNHGPTNIVFMPKLSLFIVMGISN